MAIYTVNPGGGADYTTITAALAVAGAADYISVLASINENVVTVSKLALPGSNVCFIRASVLLSYSNADSLLKEGLPFRA